MTVRTRFAPSPTGYLHVGGVRTALYAWLYARKHKGQFILRIEDTDRERSTQASVNAILQGMDWLGFDYDEGPFYQTDRQARYQEIIDRLLAQNDAYVCTCSKARLDELREAQMQLKQKPKYDGCCRDKGLSIADAEQYVIRFKNPLVGAVTFDDHVYGSITVENKELDDLIIQKSDGMPTYNLAVVVDDMDMKITDVIRGDDHINNTPRQINLFRALNAIEPRFSHLPMILGDDGKRLSKRHGAVNVMQFKENGYLAQTMLNYLVRLGWSAGDQEIFSIEEMIEKFELDSINRGGSAFAMDKLNWLNQHYMKIMPLDEITGLIAAMYAQKELQIEQGPNLETVVPAFIERSKTLVDVFNQTKFIYCDDITYDEKTVKKQFKLGIVPALETVYSMLENLAAWQEAQISKVITEVCQKHELKMPKIAQPIRIAVTGSTFSPSIDLTLSWLGKAKTLKRIKTAIEMCQA